MTDRIQGPPHDRPARNGTAMAGDGGPGRHLSGSFVSRPSRGRASGAEKWGAPCPSLARASPDRLSIYRRPEPSDGRGEASRTGTLRIYFISGVGRRREMVSVSCDGVRRSPSAGDDTVGQIRGVHGVNKGGRHGGTDPPSLATVPLTTRRRFGDRRATTRNITDPSRLSRDSVTNDCRAPTRGYGV